MRILFNISKFPYSTLEQEENVEMILFAASFDYQATVVFSGDGVWQLLKTQMPSGSQKNLANMIAAFPAFGITSFYACTEDIKLAKLEPDELSLKVNLLPSNKILQLIQQQEIVFEL